MMALDTETTGADLFHGAMPFFVTTCDEDGRQTWWEWDVDPETRRVDIPEADKAEIRAAIRGCNGIVFHNAKFDIRALEVAGVVMEWSWWEKTHDTILVDHILASNQPHNLTDTAMRWLGLDIEPLELNLQKACNECRRLVRHAYPSWRIAHKSLPEMPSARETPWKYDTWLPRELAKVSRTSNHEWHHLLRDYANADSLTTMKLWLVISEEVKRRGYWEIYLDRRKQLEVFYAMERRGVSINGPGLDSLDQEYAEESERCGNVCHNIAYSFGYNLNLPKSGNNKSLREFCFAPDPANSKAINKGPANTYEALLAADRAEEQGEHDKVEYYRDLAELSDEEIRAKTQDRCLNLPWHNRSEKTGEPSLDKETMDFWLETLEEGTKQFSFVRNLARKRKYDTARNYLEGYRRFWLPASPCPGLEGWYTLHPSFNLTGTDTLRSSSNHPNAQNISKQNDTARNINVNLRRCFCPLPGREWWSLDYENIELRIPAYEAQESEMVELFERPDDPPYYGSYHLLVAHKIHPEEFNRCLKEGVEFKNAYRSNLYQWTKNGNFAYLYGGQESTCDRAYHKPGAYRVIRKSFKNLSALNDRMILFANEYGFVETIPDKTVSPKGYPIMCSRGDWGRISPTVPLNYHIQSTACWCKLKAAVRVYGFLQEFSRKDRRGYYIIMEVHDELVLDFPKGHVGEHASKIAKIVRLMEQSGDDIGIPLKVSVSYHPNNWGETKEPEEKGETSCLRSHLGEKFLENARCTITLR